MNMMEARQVKFDSAHSWMVAGACFWINLFSSLMYKSSGVVYVAILSTFNVSRQEASWPMSLVIVFIFLTGPVAGILARRIPIWKLSVAGCLISSLGVIFCFFSTGTLFISIFFGVIQGFALGLLVLHSVIINQYFHRHRATASGISYAGPTLSSFACPPLIEVLFNTYSLRGAFLICGGLMLNSIAGAFLQRPPRPDFKYRRAVSYSTSRSDSSPALPKKYQDAGDNIQVTNSMISESANSSSIKNYHQLNNNEECLSEEEGLSSGMLPISTDSPKVITGPQDSSESPTSVKASPSTFFEDLISFLTSLMFYVICLSFAFILVNMATYSTVVVDFAIDCGISQNHAILLISTYSIADLAARLGSGWISDRGYVSRGHMMAFHFALFGLALYLMPLSTAYGVHVLLSLAFGWATGCTIILISVLLTEHLGLEKLSLTFGITSFVGGAVSLIRPPLIGYYRDTLGNYNGLFFLLGAISFVFSLLWFLVTIWERCKERKKKLEYQVCVN